MVGTPMEIASTADVRGWKRPTTKDAVPRPPPTPAPGRTIGRPHVQKRTSRAPRSTPGPSVGSHGPIRLASSLIASPSRRQSSAPAITPIGMTRSSMPARSHRGGCTDVAQDSPLAGVSRRDDPRRQQHHPESIFAADLATLFVIALSSCHCGSSPRAYDALQCRPCTPGRMRPRARSSTHQSPGSQVSCSSRAPRRRRDIKSDHADPGKAVQHPPPHQC